MTAHQSSRRFHSNFNRGGARSYLFLGVIGLLIMPIGCTSGSSENSESAPPNAAAQPVQPAPAKPAQAAPAAQATTGALNAENKPGNVKPRKKKKDDEEPAANLTAKPITKPVGEWTIDDMKTALVNKDLRYVAAVTAQGTKARGDAQKGTEIAQLLEAVALMPADAGASALSGRKKRGDDDGPQQPPANSPPAAAAAAPAAPGAAFGFGAPAKPGQFKMGRGDD